MSNGPSRAAEADFTPIAPARLQWQDHTPVATDFDDPYFSRQDGRAESLYVFLDGNQLDRRFAALADGDCDLLVNPLDPDCFPILDPDPEPTIPVPTIPVPTIPTPDPEPTTPEPTIPTPDPEPTTPQPTTPTPTIPTPGGGNGGNGNCGAT